MGVNILMITPAFPPYQGSHTQRMLAIANCLSASGLNVNVLTYEKLAGHPTYNPETEKLIANNIQVFRVECGFFHKKAYTKYSSFAKEKRGSRQENNIKASVIKRMFMNLVKFFDKIKDVIFIPDSIIDWKKPVIKYIKEKRLMEEIKPDFVLSCAMPCSVHSIGYAISRRYDVPLIMDYGDPWVYANGRKYKRHKLKFWIERAMERKYINHAKLISFSTKGCEELYCNKFNLPEHKVCTVMTGYEDWLSNICINNEENEKITLTYGGAIQDSVRDPFATFKAIDELASEGIEFIVRTDTVSKIQEYVDSNMNNKNIFVYSYIPFEDYYKEMLKADILVFFGNSTPNQLPGKIFNYLPTGKLILYVSNIQDDEKDQALQIVKDYGYYVWTVNDKESIKNALKEAINMLACDDAKVSQEKIKKYSSSNQCKILADAIVSQWSQEGRCVEE